MTLDEARRSIGASVRWYPHPLGRGVSEVGVITSVGSAFAFVRYSWQGADAHGIATRVDELELEPLPGDLPDDTPRR